MSPHRPEQIALMECLVWLWSLNYPDTYLAGVAIPMLHFVIFVVLVANDANSRDGRSCQWVNDEEHSKGCGQNAHENAPGGTLLQFLS